MSKGDWKVLYLEDKIENEADERRARVRKDTKAKRDLMEGLRDGAVTVI